MSEKPVEYVARKFTGTGKGKDAPQLSEMMQMILDADPILELYVLDNKAKYKDNPDELNKIIKKGGLKKIERLK